ncbi:hypothetical protein AVEN_253193-1 [Araneus ventricosus]|uniref:Uncharacterized protein n=1 Tax=Araneus ventricosus TaxID=182803 RepID=A0A4Y2SKI5_ARAVE|nr:hypothetical protein AVEN_243430-1 [Araneus ventricosus]GBN88326.1 hypothetical protein AVEN_253193-1 [Araneus ventricosus]
MSISNGLEISYWTTIIVDTRMTEKLNLTHSYGIRYQGAATYFILDKRKPCYPCLLPKHPKTLNDSRCNSLTAEAEALEAITGHGTTPPVRGGGMWITIVIFMASTTQLVCTGPEKTCSRQPSMYPPLTNFNRIPPFQLLNRSPPSKGLRPGQPLSRYGGHP